MKKTAEELSDCTEALSEIQNAKTKEDLQKSGAMNTLKMFIEDLEDKTTTIGKAIDTAKKGAKIAQDIAGTYNKVAEWCGLPVVPSIFLKKEKP